ncbi:MAG: 3-oxoacyl-ACP reductase FabG [Chromatiales bacterium]|nr:3-oxoacyl-ACP reductase FabG [Chromatiales bacterium]
MLENEIALVTGASRGIGRAIALELAAQGAKVVGTATTDEGAERISAMFADAGVAGSGVRLNVTDLESIEAALTATAERFGAPSLLINNAGITRDNLLVRMKNDDWDAIVQTNLTSVFHLSRLCLKSMMKARHGRIVNITSVVAASGNAGQTNYAAAKAGLIGFSKSLAREVGPRGITVNCVAPGFIATDMTEALGDKQRDALLASIPLGRLGRPEEVAACVAFLCAPNAAYVTGETLHVNGGMYMG